ncbi:MAG TPA: hypothetical protein VI229_00340 [Burkholderiales bacterium]
MERLDNVAIYDRLQAVAKELDAMAARAWSVVGATALRAGAVIIRRIASATFASTITQTQTRQSGERG